MVFVPFIPFLIIFLFFVGPAILVVALVFVAGFFATILGHKMLRGIPILRDYVPEHRDEVAERRQKEEEEEAQQAKIESEIEAEIALVAAREQRRPVDAEGARRQIASSRQMVEDAQAAAAAAEEHAKSMSGRWQDVAEAREDLERAKERLGEALEDAQRFLPLSERQVQPLITSSQAEADRFGVRASQSASGCMQGNMGSVASTAVVPPKSSLTQVTARAAHSNAGAPRATTIFSSPLANGAQQRQIQGTFSPGVGADTVCVFSRPVVGPCWIPITSVRFAPRNNNFQQCAMRWGLASLRRL